MNDELIIALLIDTENVSAKYMRTVEQSLIALGKVTYKRMYGDFTGDAPAASSKGWRELVNEFSLTPVQQYSYTSGKNVTDSRMIIDAMDILYTGNVNAVCIMSSDSDFTGLVKRLKESNIFVIGAGEKKTPQAFVNACDRFLILDDKPQEERKKERSSEAAGKASAPRKTPVKKKEDDAQAVKVATKGRIEEFCISMLETQSLDESSLEWLIQKIHQAFPQFDFKDYGVKKSYEFFDEKKFNLRRADNTNWFISLK